MLGGNVLYKSRFEINRRLPIVETWFYQALEHCPNDRMLLRFLYSTSSWSQGLNNLSPYSPLSCLGYLALLFS